MQCPRARGGFWADRADGWVGEQCANLCVQVPDAAGSSNRWVKEMDLYKILDRSLSPECAEALREALAVFKAGLVSSFSRNGGGGASSVIAPATLSSKRKAGAPACAASSPLSGSSPSQVVKPCGV